jgi:hypothetical protein
MMGTVTVDGAEGGRGNLNTGLTVDEGEHAAPHFVG